MARVIHKESQKVLNVYNLHLDNISEKAKIGGIQCAMDYIHGQAAKAPVVLMGDFNAESDSQVIALCREAFVEATKNIACSFHGYGKVKKKIDYIFVSGELGRDILDAGIWADRENGIYLSDHYPLWIRMRLSS